MAATPSQKELLEDILAALQAQSLVIATLQADITKTKNFTRWIAEYSAGADAELTDIEAGTHTF